MSKKKFLVLFFCLSISILYSNNCNNIVYQVFEDIINGIGNRFPLKPNLNIIDSEKKVAYFSKGEIFIEQKAINLFCEDDNFKDQIAYILSHEIAHYYLKHDWMKNSGLLFRSSIRDYVEDNDNLNQRKLAETQADSYAGFYSLMAGYKSLNYAENVLKKLYKEYKIPNVIRGYPSLDERIQIINANIIKSENLTVFFNAANMCLVLGNISSSKKLYEDILKNEFTTKEIFNNLGLAYLIEALNNSPENIKKYNYPFFFENNTFADLKRSRSSNINDPLKLLKTAINYFELSMEIDPLYENPKLNILICELISNIISNKLPENYYNKLGLEKIEDKAKLNDLRNLFYFFSDKKRKAKKNIINGSKISQLNFNIYNSSSIQIEEMVDLPTYSKINMDDLKFSGLDRSKSKRYRTQRGQSSIKIQTNELFKIIEIDNSNYIIEIYDSKYIEEVSKLITDKNINPMKIIEIGDLFFNVITDNLAFKISKKNIISIILKV